MSATLERSNAPSLATVQAPVRDGLDLVRHAIVRMVTIDDSLAGQATAHLLGMKGKLFRPTLVLLASDVDGNGSTEKAATAAGVVELIHVATLVHDDAVDHSVLRRGMPTLNALFSHQVSVIMGDFLYSRALTELVALSDLDMMQVLTRASTEMTLGELRQLSMLDVLHFSESDYEALIRSKTASLIAAACEIGTLCGAPRHREALRTYGDALGMAFQIVDDLLDYTEVKETTGKPTGLDLREHKMTLPLIAALRTMSPADRGLVERLFAEQSPQDGHIADVVGIVTREGGLDYARQRGEAFAEQAIAALDGVPEGPVRQALVNAVAYVMERHS
jgi:octaprenyl-diphosphate synthase